MYSYIIHVITTRHNEGLGLLDKKKPLPLYIQLKLILEEKILAGVYQPGDRIPSEAHLCEKYSISRTTVRQALKELVNEGKIDRTQGRGSFVPYSFNKRSPYRLSGFSAEMKDQGIKVQSRILDKQVFIPGTDIQHVLRLEYGEAVIHIRRLRVFQDQHIGVESTYLPFERFFPLLEEDLENKSLYRIFVDRFETAPTRVELSLSAVESTSLNLPGFQVDSGISMIHFNSITFDQNNLVFEHTLSYYRGDFYQFHVEINRLKNEKAFLLNKYE